MQVDIIIVSYSKDERLRNLTRQSIDTCRESEKEIDFNIAVIEQDDNTRHENCETIHYDFPFNYNKCLNLGVSLTSNDYVCLCNNDLVFEKHWATNIISAMNEHECHTASPFSRYTIHKQVHKVEDKVYFSHKIGREFLGWCIMCRREVFDEIKISEDVEFWYSDNIFAQQLSQANFKHCLVCNSVVNHVNRSSNTLHKMGRAKIAEYTRGQYGKYLNGIKNLRSVSPQKMKCPKKINIGSGKNFREDFLNIDASDYWKPDIVFDLNDPFPPSGAPTFRIERFGTVKIERNSFDYILANDVLEHVRELVVLMESCLNLLKVGGTFEIMVPYDLSCGAWQDPTHVRAFNEKSWLYYTDWFWYLGWKECRFMLEKFEFIFSAFGKELAKREKDTEKLSRIPRAVDAMRVILKKVNLSERDKATLRRFTAQRR